jgi:hypothetical protein
MMVDRKRGLMDDRNTGDCRVFQLDVQLQPQNRMLLIAIRTCYKNTIIRVATKRHLQKAVLFKRS